MSDPRRIDIVIRAEEPDDRLVLLGILHGALRLFAEHDKITVPVNAAKVIASWDEDHLTNAASAQLEGADLRLRFGPPRS